MTSLTSAVGARLHNLHQWDSVSGGGVTSLHTRLRMIISSSLARVDGLSGLMCLSWYVNPPGFHHILEQMPSIYDMKANLLTPRTKQARLECWLSFQIDGETRGPRGDSAHLQPVLKNAQRGFAETLLAKEGGDTAQENSSQSHAARVFSGGGAVADERQLLLHLGFRLCFRRRADVVALGEALRDYFDLCPVICHVLGVHRQSPVVPPAAVATVTVAVNAYFTVTAHQKRGHGVRRARWGDQEGFAALSGGVGPHVILAPDVAGEGSSVGPIEEGVDQRVDSRGDVAHPHEDVEEVVKQRLVAGAPAEDKRDVGDEEGAPHDEEEEKDDSQDLKSAREPQRGV